LIRKSKIGVELTDEQCATLSDVIEVGKYADGDVVVAEGGIDDKLRIILAGALAVAKQGEEGDWMRECTDSGGSRASWPSMIRGHAMRLWSHWGRPKYLRCSAPSSKGCSLKIRISSIASCARLRALLTRFCIAPARR